MHHWIAVLLLSLLMIGCAAKSTPQAAIVNPLDRPPTAGSLPLVPGNPDRSCKTNADCVVKNVGNCCGYYPACLNKAAKTDPAAVQAQCAKSGMAGVCGFPAVVGCTCVRGLCQADNGVSKEL